MIRWTTLFLDRPADGFDATSDFWLAATGTTASPTRGDHGEFATLRPPAGDSHLRIQRVASGPGGSHLDLHTDDVRAAADSAVRLGASEILEHDGVVRLRSPGGLVFCSVAHHGESVRSAPTPIDDDGHRTRSDQVCIDIAPDRFDSEYRFWAELTGWSPEAGVEPGFAALVRPDDQPLRFLFQPLGEADRGRDAGCHLDIACDDVGAAIAHHESLGASVVSTFDWWTVMVDPAGVEYCLTTRDPDTSLPT